MLFTWCNHIWLTGELICSWCLKSPGEGFITCQPHILCCTSSQFNYSFIIWVSLITETVLEEKLLRARFLKIIPPSVCVCTCGVTLVEEIMPLSFGQKVFLVSFFHLSLKGRSARLRFLFLLFLNTVQSTKGRQPSRSFISHQQLHTHYRVRKKMKEISMQSAS